MEKILSVIVNAGHRDRLKPFLDSFNNTCHSKRSFEVCIMISEEHLELEQDILRYQKEYEFEIRYAKTANKYEQGNKNSNFGIFHVSDQSTYFIQIVSDRYRYSNKDWDLFLEKYIGLVPDDIFFLRTANYSKNLKPRNSLYQAFSFNDTWSFYTRKMLITTGGFPETIPSHDCGFEMMYYYIRKNNPQDKFVRDITAPYLDDSALVQSIESDSKRSLFYYRSSMFFLGRCGFFSREMIENLICQSRIFYLNLLMSSCEFSGKIIKDDVRKIVAIDEGHKITNQISYKARILEIIAAKLEARKSANHPMSFLVDLFIITQFTCGRKFLTFLLQKIITEKSKKSLSKKLAKRSLELLCGFFFIGFPNCHECLKLLSDPDYLNGVLLNNEFKKQFKNYHKTMGRFVILNN